MAEEISPLENHGWWMEQLRKDAKAQQPEALRLADQMLHYWDERGPDAEEVAAELRRLHAENEVIKHNSARLSQRLARTSDALMDARAQRDELLEALKGLVTAPPDVSTYGAALRNARAAIAKAEEL